MKPHRALWQPATQVDSEMARTAFMVFGPE